MSHVRFSLNHHLPPSAPDGPEVHYGILNGHAITRTAGFLATEPTGEAYPLSDVKLLPPSYPTKIVCVGRNYAEHAKELGNAVPTEPLIFLKPPSSLNAQDDPIVYPPSSERLDFEGELGLVIGHRARHLHRDDALRFLAGFTIINDMTARDLQRKDVQFTRGKGFDTFCCVGPVMIPTPDFDLSAATLQTRVNGDLRQNGLVRDMLFSIGVILEFVSTVMTLEPGDLIATGTPPGVGPVDPGDLIEVSIAGIGTLRNRVLKG